MTPPRSVGAWWLERQCDPESPDFVPGGDRANVTHRDWVHLGTVGSTRRAIVDPRGLVTMPEGGWSIDWWIGADDRWHLPSREVAVRQQRLDGAPIIETSMRVPGGDAVHRAYAVQHGGGDHVVIEIENKSAVPFAVALVVRPYNPLGRAAIRDVRVVGNELRVDGRPALVLPKPPPRISIGCEDVLSEVVDGAAAQPTGEDRVTCADGTTNGAVVFPLAHTATLRVLAPRAVVGRASTSPSSTDPPSPSQVVRGWSAQVDRTVRFELPDDRLARVLAAARHDLLLFHAGNRVASWPDDRLSWPSTARVLTAMGQIGYRNEVEQVLAALPDHQRLDGSLSPTDADEGWAAPGAVLHALGRRWQLTHDTSLVEQLVGPIAKAAHWIEKRRTARRRNFFEHATAVDAMWSIGGLRMIEPALAAAGQPEVAEDAAAFAERLAADVERRMDVDSDAAAVLVGVRLGVLAPDDVRVRATIERLLERTAGGLVLDASGWGLSARLTLDLALAELLAGDAGALDRVHAVVEHASPASTWPEVMHPRTKGGSAGRGHDPVTSAAYCTFLRTMLVREESEGLVLASMVPSAWLGASWEVHGVPTAFGRLSYAVRWHGERPAVLWELDPHDDLRADPASVRLRAPGLDPGWSSTDVRGEALLAPVPDRSGSPTVGGGDAEASSSFA